jgi:hypothetical protein
MFLQQGILQYDLVSEPFRETGWVQVERFSCGVAGTVPRSEMHKHVPTHARLQDASTGTHL